MEFKTVLKTLIERFNEQGIDFALIGAFAIPETSHYISPLAVFGRVDFLHARREYSHKMLQRAKQEAVFSGAF